MIRLTFDTDKVKSIEDQQLLLRLTHYSGSQFFYTIILKDIGRRIGYCDIRTSHEDELLFYGNIGYRIDKRYRGHSYAYKASLLLLKVAKKLNMDYLFITCSPENIASDKTIQKLNATYINTLSVPIWHPLFESEKVKKIYRIDL